MAGTRATRRVDPSSSKIFKPGRDNAQVAGERGQAVGSESTVVGREPVIIGVFSAMFRLVGCFPVQSKATPFDRVFPIAW